MAGRFGGSSVYNTAGETLSEKSACAAYNLTVDQLKAAWEEKKVTIRHRSCHGNAYRLYIRSEVEALGKSLRGADYEVDEQKKALRVVVAELETVESKMVSLKARKATIEATIVKLGGTVEEPVAKKARKTKTKRDS
eukprot:jgi/Chrzof1/12326/Cz06g30130.t1